MKRALVWALIGILSLVLLVPSAFYLLVRSETGSRWLLAQIIDRAPARISYAELNGNLLQGMNFSDLQVLQDGLSLRAAALDVAWQPQLLWFGTLHFERLQVVDLRIEHQTTTAPSDSASWPSISLPLRIAIDQLELDTLSFNGETLVDRVRLAASLSGSSLAVDQLHLQRADSTLELSGRLRLSANYPMDLALVWTHSDRAWQGQAQVRGNLEQLQVTHALQAPYLVQSELTLTQELPDNPTDLSLAGLRFEGLHRADQLDLRDRLGESGLFQNLRLETRGSLEQVNIDVQTGLSLPWLNQSGLQAEGTYQNGVLTLSHAELTSERGLIEADGLTFNLDERQLNLDQLTTYALVVTDFLQPVEAALAGVSLNFDGPLRMEAELTRALIVQEQVEITARGALRYADGQLETEQLTVEADTNQLVAKGLLFPQPDLTWNLEGRQLAPLIQALVGLQIDLVELSAQGRLQGSYDQPQLSAQVMGGPLRVGTIALDEWQAQLRPVAQRHQFNLEVPLALMRGHELRNLLLQGELWPVGVDIQANLELDNLRLALTGGGRRDPLWQLRLDSLDLQGSEAVGNWQLDQVWRAEQQTDGWQLGQACWYSGEASLCGEGQWQYGGAVRANLSLRDLPLDFVQYLVPVPLRVQGQLNGDFGLSGTADAPVFQASLQSGAGSFAVLGQDRAPEAVGFRALQVNANLVDQLLTADAAFELGDSGRATAQGSLDFNPQQPQLEAGLTLDFSSLQWIEGLVPQLDAVTGDLDLQLTLSGAWQQPDMDLHGSLLNGSLIIPRAGIELSEVRLLAQSTSPNSVNLEAQALSAEGRIELAGQISAPAFDAVEAQASIRGENFQLLDQPDLSLRVNPDLRVNYQAGEIAIEGSLGIPQAQARVRNRPVDSIRPSDDEVLVSQSGTQRSRLLQSRIDVQIQLGSEVEFQGFGLTTGLTGSLEVSQAPDEPRRTFGSIELQDGQYQAYGRTLVVQRGRMIFQGELDNPALDIDVEQAYTDYVVGIHLGGTAQDPSTTLYSNPVMSQSDVLAVLLTGRKLDTMAASEAPTLLDAATRLGIAGGAAIADRIEDTFGLSEFGVRNDAQNGQSIVAGTYLLPRLYVEWAQGLFESSSSVQLEYRINNQLRLKARSGISQSMDLIYEIERD